jgi:hypothetical protein
VTEHPLLDLVSLSSEDVNLLNEFWGNYSRDPIFEAIIKKLKDFRNFLVEDEIIYLNQDGNKVLCVPKILINGRSAHEIIISEAHSLLAHLGAAKTISYPRDHVWWKDIVSDTKAYCDTCITCKRNKPSNQKPYGLLNPLKIPSYPWESIGVELPLGVDRSRLCRSLTTV